MALFKEVKCGRCDRRYSALRSKCPHCGARKNRDGKDASAGKGSAVQVATYAIVLLAVIAAVIVLVCTSLKDKEPEQTGKPSPTPGDPSGGISTIVGTDPTPELTPEPTPEITPEPTPISTPEPVVNSITLSREDFTLSKIGETYTITATISPAGSPAEIIWISEDPKVASVDENGTVTAVDRGTTIVSAMAGGVISECIVRVNADAPHTSEPETGATAGDLSLSNSDVTINSATGETFTLSVRNLPADAAVSYSSDNASAATVDTNGLVKAVSKGTANITVSVTVGSETQTMKCIVRVR